MSSRPSVDTQDINPFLTNVLLGESTFVFRGFRYDFKFLSLFSMKFL